MKRIAILVPETAVMAAVTDPRYLFTAANQFLQAAGKPALFEVVLVGASPVVSLGGGAFSVHPDYQLTDMPTADLIVVPALSGDLETALRQNAALVPWIVAQRRAGAEVASLCIGAFLLAATGLLDGKKCSTHWLFAPQFRAMFPQVTLVDGSIITEENGLYSSGGAMSYWNLLLHLLEKYTDRETAVMAAKFFAVEIDRNSQSAFMIFNGQKDHGDAAILQAQTYIESHVDERMAVADLADRFAMGRRSFERRFKQATRTTVVDYIQRVKVEVAKRQLENSRRQIIEVMVAVGYTDAKAFRDVFRAITGLTPVAYRSKFQQTGLPAREPEH